MKKKDGDTNVAKSTCIRTLLSLKFDQNFAATVSANPTKSLSSATAASLEIELSEMEE